MTIKERLVRIDKKHPDFRTNGRIPRSHQPNHK
jgi:hypothetical protein